MLKSNRIKNSLIVQSAIDSVQGNLESYLSTGTIPHNGSYKVSTTSSYMKPGSTFSSPSNFAKYSTHGYNPTIPQTTPSFTPAFVPSETFVPPSFQTGASFAPPSVTGTPFVPGSTFKSSLVPGSTFKSSLVPGSTFKPPSAAGTPFVPSNPFQTSPSTTGTPFVPPSTAGKPFGAFATQSPPKNTPFSTMFTQSPSNTGIDFSPNITPVQNVVSPKPFAPRSDLSLGKARPFK